MTRAGATFPFANLANAAIRGWLTQFGTRISVFAGSANGAAVAQRTIEGQSTLQARTNHQLAIDSVHDEIVAPNPFAQAILFFRGGANGEEAPVRTLQGARTGLSRPETVAVDEKNN